MYTSSTTNLKLPEWYTFERSAEKTIEKLNTLRELDYYIKHPDESMRRLAILRISALKLKDSISGLKEIMDDPSESQPNKELAAWTIKSIALRYDIDLFISHRLLTRYTGNEKLSELFALHVDKDVPLPSFSFSSLPAECRIDLQSTNMRSSRDAAPDMKLNCSVWLAAVLKRLGQKTLENLKSALVSTGCSLYKLLQDIPGYLKKALCRKAHADKPGITSKPRTAKKIIIGTDGRSVPNQDINSDKNSNNFKKSGESLLDRNTGSFIYGGSRRQPELTPAKAVHDVLYILLFPVRLALKPFRLICRHKLAAAAVLLLIYSTLAFTSYGRVATIKYLGVDLQSFHINAAENIRQVSGFALKEFNNLAGINEAVPGPPAGEARVSAPASAPLKSVLTVKTKKGLNIRVSPSSSSAKTGSILEPGTEITFLDKTQNDSEGRPWYYIKAPDGTTGWVYSGGLGEKEAGDNDK